MNKIAAGLLCVVMLLNANTVFTAGNAAADDIQNLIELKIVDAADVRAGDYLTYSECFRFLLRAGGAEDEEEWDGEYEKLLGDRPAWQKEIIYKLSSLIVQKDE